jgi:hypothetical protein
MMQQGYSITHGKLNIHLEKKLQEIMNLEENCQIINILLVKEEWY